MATLVFESRFCTFEVPRGWDLVPGLGAVQRRSGGGGRSLVVMENWLDPPQNARDYAEAQKTMALRQLPGLVVVRDEELRDERFADAHVTVFRPPPVTGKAASRPIVQAQLVTANGPLVCALTLSGPEDEESFATLGQAVASFTVTSKEAVGTIKRTPLPVAAPAAPEAPKAVEEVQMVEAPLLGLRLPIPPDATFDETGGRIQLPGGATIEVQSLGLAGGAADGVFADALAKAMRQPGCRIMSWDKGETASGKPYWTLEVRCEQARNWGKPEIIVRRSVLIEDQGVLRFESMEGEGHAAAPAALLALVAGYRWLPPEQRRLAVREVWIDAVLDGPWSAASPGVYVRLAKPSLVVALQRLPKDLDARGFIEATAKALRDRPEVARITGDELTPGLWKGRQACRWTLDFEAAGDGKKAVRIACMEASKDLCIINVQGGDTQAVASLFARLLDAVRPEAMEDSPGVKGVKKP